MVKPGKYLVYIFPASFVSIKPFARLAVVAFNRKDYLV